MTRCWRSHGGRRSSRLVLLALLFAAAIAASEAGALSGWMERDGGGGGRDEDEAELRMLQASALKGRGGSGDEELDDLSYSFGIGTGRGGDDDGEGFPMALAPGAAIPLPLRAPATTTRWAENELQLAPLKRNLYKNSRFGRRRRKKKKSSSGGGADAADVDQIRMAITVWEAKLLKFAEKYANSPGQLSGNPAWLRLLQVRDSLRRMLVQSQQVTGLDQTRM